MKLTKTDIVEYIVVFVGIVGVFAYIHATTAANPVLSALEASPMMIEAGWTIRADAGPSVARFREVAPADTRARDSSRVSFASPRNTGKMCRLSKVLIHPIERRLGPNSYYRT